MLCFVLLSFSFFKSGFDFALFLCSEGDLLDSSIYGPQPTNGSHAPPERLDHHQLDMSGYEGQTLGQPPSKSGKTKLLLTQKLTQNLLYRH